MARDDEAPSLWELFFLSVIYGAWKGRKPSAELAAIIGPKRVRQNRAVKLLWKYIAEHRLQQGAVIQTDEKLKALADGREQFSMFDLIPILKRHLR